MSREKAWSIDTDSSGHHRFIIYVTQFFRSPHLILLIQRLSWYTLNLVWYNQMLKMNNFRLNLQIPNISIKKANTIDENA